MENISIIFTDTNSVRSKILHKNTWSVIKTIYLAIKI